jgi:hypothetical protein
MFCKACNTRVDQERYCPNCGRAVRSTAPGEEGHPESSESSPRQLSPSSARDFSEPDVEGEPESEVELDAEIEAVPLELEESVPPPKSHPVARRRPTAQPVVRAAADREPGSTGFTPSEVRALVAEQPGLVEPGLRLWRDRASKATGAGYKSEVGEIDLLAQDDAGSLMVVMVADPGSGKELVGEVLQRMGWARKHLAKQGQEVRGIVLLSSLPEELGYAAAAVSDTICFKTWRVTLSFQNVEL